MSIANVKKNIKKIYNRRRAALYALALDYAAIAIRYFREVQPPKPNSQGKFWYNRTGGAAARMFTKPYIEKNIVGWIMSHAVQYGVYLELANDRRNEAIRPIIKRYAGRFFRDAEKFFKD